MKKFKQNNQGSTLVLVLVTLSLIGVLATVGVWVTIKNFEAKNTDQQITDNFYSAEGVLEQLTAGLQVEASAAISSAYYNVMENYKTLDTEDKRNTEFAKQYMVYLRGKLAYLPGEDEDPAAARTDIKCNLKWLVDKYVSIPADVDIKITSGDGGTNDQYCYMSSTTRGLLIKDIRVDYTDQKGYYSHITTDFLIEVPDMNMVSAEMLPDLFAYSLIGNQGLTVGGKGTKIVGSIFAGSEHSVDPTKTSKSAYASLIVGRNASGSATDGTLEFINDPRLVSDPELLRNFYVVVDGDAYAYGTGADGNVLQTADDGKLWARNLLVDTGKASLTGITYMADDLTLAGDQPEVNFASKPGASCIYIGYGRSKTDAAESSSIVINGKKSKLDLSQLNQLQLSGYSFIATGNLAASVAGITHDNVALGESISVKGDQIAYMVPAECIGTEGSSSDAASKYMMNPLSYSQYRDLVDNSDKYQMINPSIKISKNGRTLTNYIGPGEELSDHIRKIFVPSLAGGGNEGLVYFYLDLSPELAAEFYLDYYDDASGKNANKLEKYVGFYTESIQSADTESIIYTAGVTAAYDKTKPGGNKLELSGTFGTDVASASESYANAYTALSKRLVTDYASLTQPQKDNCLFQNIIKETEFSSFVLRHASGSGFVDTSFRAFTGLENINAVLVKGDYIYDSSAPANTRLIIATGDVTVRKDFTGTIIAKGRIIVPDANVTIKIGSKKEFKLLLSAETDFEGSKVRLADYLVDGGTYLLQSSDAESAQKVDLSDLVSYQNWTKR